MTRKEFIDALLEIGNDDTEVSVTCEVGGWPHPIWGVSGDDQRIRINQSSWVDLKDDDDDDDEEE